MQFTIDLTPLPPDHLGEPDTPYAMCAFNFGLDHAFTLLRTDSHSLIPNAGCLELCAQYFQQEINNPSLEAPATCTPTYHLQLDAHHACTHLENQIHTRPKSYMQEDQLRTYTRTDLIFWVYGTQEPVCDLAQKTFYHVHSQALL